MQSKVRELKAFVVEAASQMPSQKLEVDTLYAALQALGAEASQLPSQKLEVEKPHGLQVVELQSKVHERIACDADATSQLPSQKLEVVPNRRRHSDVYRLWHSSSPRQAAAHRATALLESRVVATAVRPFKLR